MAEKHRVLVVDDDQGIREVLEMVLENRGYAVEIAENVAAAQARLEAGQYDAVLTDLRMGADHKAGMRLLEWIQGNAPNTPAIMMTAYGGVPTAIEAMKCGAADYVMKPFDNDEIRLLVERAIEQQKLRRENLAFRRQLARESKLENMVGQSEAFQAVLDMVRRVATLPSTVAIRGESGAGKELVARALHGLSDRADKPFVAINCGGIPENLLESELFGYKKGAFTGAVEDKEGLFVVANGGSVFLDEIGEMPPMLQVKLLRVLDNNVVTPVGGTASITVNVRIISATNRDLAAMVEEGGFRKDLYYRLNVIPLLVPPLRERGEDIPLLARHFVARHAEAMGRPPLELSPEADAALAGHDWPGNVRELSNVIERTVALCAGPSIEPEDLPPEIHAASGGEALSAPTPEAAANFDQGPIDLEGIIAELEQDLIQRALQKSKYSQKKAAHLLGLTPRSLRYRLRKYGLEAT